MRDTPAWLSVLIAHVQECGIRRGVAHVEIRHDDDCGHWQRKPCDCDPVIEAGQRIDRKYGTEGER